MNDEALSCEFPYIGLRPYKSKDGLLYTGRTSDVEFCFETKINSPLVRVLVIHGLSGSGKSSFLQAGLLPKIATQLPTRENVGFKLLLGKDGVVTGGPSMMEELAKKVYYSLQEMSHEQVIGGWEWLRKNYPDENCFAQMVTKDLSHLRELLIRLSDDPRIIWVLTIDHVERVLSLDDEENKKVKEDFFKLVNDFDLETFNAKLILSIRTERYGQFASELPQFQHTTTSGPYSVNRLAHHFIGTLDEKSLIKIVKLPSIAHHKFKVLIKYNLFSYAEGVPEEIVRFVLTLNEVKRKEMEPLPVLQAICSTLYQINKARSKVENGVISITTSDFDQFKSSPRCFSVRHIIDSYIEMAFNQIKVVEAIDQARWSRVLSEMVSDKSSKTIFTKQSSYSVLKRQANKEGYDNETIKSVISGLISEPFPILIDLGSGWYSFQHDILAVALKDDRPIAEKLSIQAVERQFGRIKVGGTYTLDDLNEDPSMQIVTQLLAIDLHYWDHQFLAFAVEKGFFERLKINVVFCSGDNDSENRSKHLVDRCRNKNQDICIFTYPRHLMNMEETKSYSDIAILNVFTGFAIVGGRKFLDNDNEYLDPISAFNKLTEHLLESEKNFILIEERGGKEFLRDLESAFLDFSSGAKKFRLSDQIKLVDKNLSSKDILRALEVDCCVAAVLTPSMRAIAHEVKLPTLIDQGSVISLIQQDNRFIKVRGQFLQKLHNFLNISIPPENIFDSAENERIYNQLISVVLFTSEYILSNDEEFVDWFYEKQYMETRSSSFSERPTNYQPSKQSVLEIFRRSYINFPAASYQESYFDPGSPYCYTPLSDDSGVHKSVSHKGYTKFSNLRDEYVLLAREIEILLFDLDENSDHPLSKLSDVARKHAQIYNYYDATMYLKIIKENLNGV